MRFVLCVTLLVLSLTACNSTEAPTDLPFHTATPQFVAPVERPEQSDNNIELPDFIGGDPQELVLGSSFQFTIGGDVQAAATIGTIAYNYVPPAGNVSARDTIFISASDATASQQIAFTFSPGLGVGSHPIGSLTDWIPGRVAAQYLRLSDDGSGETRIQSYSQNVSGSLNLSAVGATISGTFEFTAEWITGNDSGETVTRTVTVSGEFSDVNYSQLNDPFDVQQVVPARATPQPLVGSE